MPKRTSFPSMLPPGFDRGRRDVDAARRVDRIAARLGPVRRRRRRRRTARTSPPTPPSRGAAFSTIRPSMYVSADGITKIANIDQKLVHGVGFSNGCAAFALKKPPPFVPSCLIALLARHRPHRDRLLRALERRDLEVRREVLDHALLHEQQREHERERQQHVERAAHEVDPEVADASRADAARAMPRTNATATAMPTAADTKLWNASCVICEKYDIVVSPPYDCQFVFVVNDAAVSNACRSVTAAKSLRVERQHVLQPQHEVGEQHRRDAEEQHAGRVARPVLVLVGVDAAHAVDRRARRARATRSSRRRRARGRGRAASRRAARTRRRTRICSQPLRRSCQNFSGRSSV